MIRPKMGLFAISIAFPFFAAMSLSASAAEYRAVKEPIDQQYIVVLKENSARLANESNRAGTPAVGNVANDIARSYGASMMHSYDHVLRGFSIRASDDSMLRMLKDPRIDYIEEDAVAHASATTTQTGATWGIDRIDQRDGTNGTYTYTTTAGNVHAYIIDTGVLGTHTEFTIPTNRMRTGVNETGLTGGTTDCNGHGTHVAGTVGGTTWGVAKGVLIHPVRVLDCYGRGGTSQILAGMDWVTTNRIKPAVANMSLGFTGVVSSIDTAVANMTNAGVTVVVAAGNSGADACFNSPADAPSAITVGSIRVLTSPSNGGRSGFSNYGKCVKMFAPGESITSAWIGSTSATNIISGTSMASPHVAGAAALYLATNPTATPSQVASYLAQTATPSRVLAAGAGSPNLLLYSLTGTTPALPAEAAPTVTLTCDGSGGGNTFTCTVGYTSSTPVAIYWPDDTKRGTRYGGSCVDYQPSPNSTTWVNVTVPVTVGNYGGSTPKQTTFSCFLGGQVQ